MDLLHEVAEAAAEVDLPREEEEVLLREVDAAGLRRVAEAGEVTN